MMMSGLKSVISCTCRSVKPPLTGMTAAPRCSRAVMRAEAAGEQAVAVGDVDLVAAPAAGRADRARHQARPGLDVGLRVADHGRLAGRAARGMDAHDLVHRHGEHAERIVLPQVFLGRERKSREVGELPQIGRMHARCVELLLVVRRRDRRRASARRAGARAAARAARRCLPFRSARADRCRPWDAPGGRSVRDVPLRKSMRRTGSRRYSRGAASLHTSTHSAPVSCAMRSGEIRSALLREPAAGTTSSNAFSDTSQ